MDTTLSIEQVETILTGYPDSPYYIRKNIVIPNCNWGFLNHEADLLVLTNTKRLIEIETMDAKEFNDIIKAHEHCEDLAENAAAVSPVTEPVAAPQSENTEIEATGAVSESEGEVK